VWNKLLLGPAYFLTKKISLIVSQLNSDVTVTAVCSRFEIQLAKIRIRPTVLLKLLQAVVRSKI
jgi:hypothetical protein